MTCADINPIKSSSSIDFTLRVSVSPGCTPLLKPALCTLGESPFTEVLLSFISVVLFLANSQAKPALVHSFYLHNPG